MAALIRLSPCVINEEDVFALGLLALLAVLVRLDWLLSIVELDDSSIDTSDSSLFLFCSFTIQAATLAILLCPKACLFSVVWSSCVMSLL